MYVLDFVPRFAGGSEPYTMCELKGFQRYFYSHFGSDDSFPENGEFRFHFGDSQWVDLNFADFYDRDKPPIRIRGRSETDIAFIFMEMFREGVSIPFDPRKICKIE